MQDVLIAGDSLNHYISVPAYPATAGWTLKLRMVPRQAGGAAVLLTASADGERYLLQVPASVSAVWPPGTYAWSAWVEKSTERYVVESGQLRIDPNPATMTAGTDTRSAAEQALEAVRARLRGDASAGVMAYQINGRQLQRYPLAELAKLERKLAAEVAAERRARGVADYTGTARRILVRMR